MAYVSVVLYVAALFFPSLRISRDRTHHAYLPSIMALTFGWYSTYIWLANPIYLMSLMFYKKQLSVLALAFASFIFMFKKFTDPEIGCNVYVTGYAIGAYLWFFAIIINVVVNFI